MELLKELELKRYNPEYEELYKYLSFKDINNIFDLSVHNPDSNYEKNYESINISLMDKRLPGEIRIRKYFTNYIICIETNKVLESNNEINYEKVEYYSSKNLSYLIKQLDKILNKFLKEDKSA